MSLETDKTRLEGAKETLKNWLTDKGVAVPQGALIDALVALLEEVQTGVDTTTASPPAANDIAIGKTCWANGEKITGTLPVADGPHSLTVTNIYDYTSKPNPSIMMRENGFGPIAIRNELHIYVYSDRFQRLYNLTSAYLYPAGTAMYTAYQEGVDSV